jgi:ATP-binding cassette subfamily F protein 3
MEAQAQLAQAEAADDGHAIAEAHHAISDAGGFDARARRTGHAAGSGLSNRPARCAGEQLLGGWRMRLQLARALMCPADLMLLDEPTNHLDLDALVWLEAWLQRYEGTLVVISHDREFLDAITRVTLHLEDTKLTRYTGNYTASRRCVPSACRSSRRATSGSRSASRTCRSSSTASRPRPPRPGRRRAA